MKIIKSSEEIQTITNSSELENHSFGIKAKNLPILIGLLRNDVYSDKILAIIREYSCNAHDANVEAGKKDWPISVSLPNKFDQSLKIRDYGNGLNRQEIVDTFISYGESTKRNTNDAIGQMGIGSKAGFCYTDNFIVTSFNSGIKTVYNCAIGEDSVGSLIVMHSSQMGKDDLPGIEIVINIKLADVETVRKTALNFFKFWRVMPDVNFNKEEEEQLLKKKEILFSGSNWEISASKQSYNSYYSVDQKSYAVMGNTPYPIDWNTCFSSAIDWNEEISDFILYLRSESFILQVPIGSVQFSPSRESLQYTDHTKKVIKDLILEVFAEFKTNISKQFKNCKNLFEARSLYGKLFSNNGNYNLRRLCKHIKIIWADKLINQEYLDISASNRRERWCFLYENTGDKIKQKSAKSGVDNILCSEEKKFLLMDSRKIGEKKAAELIFEENDEIKFVYVIKFQSEETKKKVLEGEIGTYPMIKYSDLHETLKSRRGLKSNKQENNKKAKVIKIPNVINDVSGFEFSKKYETTESFFQSKLDLKAEKGFYIKKANGQFDSVFGTDIGSIRKNIDCYKILSNDVALNKIYIFGQKIMQSKDFKDNEKNWTEVSQYVDEGLDNLLKLQSFLDYGVFREAMKLVDSAKCLSFILENEKILNEILKNPNCKDGPFNDFFTIKSSIINGAIKKLQENNFHSILHRMKITNQEIKNNEYYKRLKKCFLDIKTTYPMIGYFNKPYGILDGFDKIIIDYIEDMNSIKSYKEKDNTLDQTLMKSA